MGLVKALKVTRGMTVKLVHEKEKHEWRTLAPHPTHGHWWLQRWDESGKWITDHAHTSTMQQVIP
jgi:hypothetical protein